MRTLRLKERSTDRIVKFEAWDTDPTVSLHVGEPDNLYSVFLSNRQIEAIVNWGKDYLLQRGIEDSFQHPIGPLAS